MDLTNLKGLGPARRDKLTDAGVPDVESLADVDLEELEDQVDIPRGTLEGFVDQAQDIVELGDLDGVTTEDLDKLVEAGIRSPKDLRGEDAGEIAAAAGIGTERVQEWQASLGGTSKAKQAAQEAVDSVDPDKPGVVESAEKMQEGALAASDALADRLTEARVVLEEGITDARIKFEDDVLAEARILPLKAREDAEEMLEEMQGNVVVLREAADDALVRVEGEIREGLPVFKQRIDEATQQAEESAEEVRVRVEEIRDKRVLPKAEGLKAKVKDLFGLD